MEKMEIDVTSEKESTDKRKIAKGLGLLLLNSMHFFILFIGASKLPNKLFLLSRLNLYRGISSLGVSQRL